MIKVTSPQEMYGVDEKILEKVIAEFERKLKLKEKGSAQYFLTIEGEHPRILYDKIEEIYKEAGWGFVSVNSTSEKGELPGLSIMVLRRK
jgi:hypothetical protein